MTHLAWWPYIVLAGAGVGICTGLFGVGGSSVATPVLALVGVFTGLLANGGGFLIVPLYLLVFGLQFREAVALACWSSSCWPSRRW
jgi:uncharacterized membrane protein YfcA